MLKRTSDCSIHVLQTLKGSVQGRTGIRCHIRAPMVSNEVFQDIIVSDAHLRTRPLLRTKISAIGDASPCDMHEHGFRVGKIFWLQGNPRGINTKEICEAISVTQDPRLCFTLYNNE